MKTVMDREQIKNEWVDMDGKLTALVEFMDSEEYRALPEHEKKLIDRQLQAQGDYERCLEIRARSEEDRSYAFFMELRTLLEKYDASICHEGSCGSVFVNIGVSDKVHHTGDLDSESIEEFVYF